VATATNTPMASSNSLAVCSQIFARQLGLVSVLAALRLVLGLWAWLFPSSLEGSMPRGLHRRT
jgi:hypothetical protein